jgi:ubiquitin-conjugating enzyme E2 J1
MVSCFVTPHTQDVRELNTHPSARYHANPLEVCIHTRYVLSSVLHYRTLEKENMFEWHFTIRGPSGTPFEQGAYHGRILLPSEYPFKPPNIVFMTVHIHQCSGLR